MKRRDVGTAVARLYDLLLPVLTPCDDERGDMRLRLTLAIVGDGSDECVNGRQLGQLDGIAGSCLRAARKLLDGIDDGTSIQYDALDASELTLDDIAAFRDELHARYKVLDRYARIHSIEINLDALDEYDDDDA